MFGLGDMMGKMQEQQDALRQQLSEIKIETSSSDGSIKITATATREIVDISIDKSIVNPEEVEQLEDILLDTICKALEIARATRNGGLGRKVMAGMGRLYVETGETKNAEPITAGCPRATAAPIVVGMPLARTQNARFSAATAAPFVMPM